MGLATLLARARADFTDTPTARRTIVRTGRDLPGGQGRASYIDVPTALNRHKAV